MLSFIILCYGQVIVDSFIFIYFEQLGSHYTMMGCTVLLTVLFEIPLFAIGHDLLHNYGSIRLLQIGMICYIIRVFGYSVLPQGHVIYTLLLEPLHGITYACSQTSIVDFVHVRIPKGYEATGQSYKYLFRSLGSIIGLFIGGYMIDTIGARLLYRSSAIIVTLGCIIISIVAYGKNVSSSTTTTSRQPIHCNTNDNGCNEVISDKR
jgi:MFS transporter, PPP family, 3-phenylpropionic acid transporter